MKPLALFLCFITSQLFAQAPKPSGDLMGRFYVVVDDEVRIFVNGTLVYHAGMGNSVSPEVALKPGDRVVAQLHDGGGEKRFKVLYMSSDQRSLVSFQRSNMRLITDPATVDFQTADWMKWSRQPKALPNTAKDVLPFKNSSDSVWGDKNDCIVGSLVTAEMIRPYTPPPGAAAAQQQPIVLTVEAWVDGGSTLIVKRDGISWLNGNFAKPGELREPTFVNGKAWMPKWGIPTQGRGFDRSDVFPITLEAMDLNVELAGNMEKRGLDVVDPSRSPIAVKKHPNDIEIFIPDAQGGARWYKLVFRKKN